MTCQAGTCNEKNECIQSCHDPNCFECLHSNVKGCKVCTKGTLVDGCCVQNDCIQVKGQGKNEQYKYEKEANGFPAYKNTGSGRWISMYCCNIGWAITTKAGGGSYYENSGITEGDVVLTSGKWLELERCFPECEGKTCGPAPECYKGEGTCGACGCTWEVDENGGPNCAAPGEEGGEGRATTSTTSTTTRAGAATTTTGGEAATTTTTDEKEFPVQTSFAGITIPGIIILAFAFF